MSSDLLSGVQEHIERLGYSPTEVAKELLGVSRATVYELISSGQLPARKLGRRTVVLREDVVEFLRGLPAWEPQS